MPIENSAPLLQTEKLTKRFGEVKANQDVSFEIDPGEIHCLLGENGAGKTTLAECLYGYYSPESGEIYFNQERVNISSPHDAIRLGIGMVHQHFILVKPLTVIENIIVGTEAAHLFLNLSKASERLEKLCHDYDISLDLSAKIWQLSVGEQQWVEILKALFVGVKLLILDEPTAVLTPQEADKLFAIIRKMKQEGLSILFITHKLNEVIEVSDRVTVLRRGEKVATVKTSDVNRADLAKMMVGRDVLFRVNKKVVEIGEPVLEVKDIRARNDRGHEALCGVSLDVKAGEIVGIAGVSGNGQKELFESIIGVRRIVSGKIFLSGTNITKQSVHSIASMGMAHIPEDRLKEGLVQDFSVAENLILGLHKRRFFRFWGGVIDKKDMETFAESSIKKFDIVTPSSSSATRNLSGGNIQKVIIARELSGQPKCLVANQPTRGLDVGAIEYVHTQLLNQCKEGTATLIISDDLDEIINLADRVLVMFKGAIVGEMDPTKASRQEIGLLMAGCLEGEQ